MINLGIIGMSDGNGHPYSWSAIFNGYDPAHMVNCEYPAITEYLSHQSWPNCRISGAKVTHIWTQDIVKSYEIARSSLIPNVVRNIDEMIEAIDGILLARDDAENHFKLAKPFIDAGVPIYIDKPVALSRAQLKSLYDLEKYPGQIFTCSALRYSTELSLSRPEIEALGNLENIIAVTANSWDKYAIHIVEPVLKLVGNQAKIAKSERIKHCNFDKNGASSLIVDWDSGVQTIFTASGTGKTPISIRVMGDVGYIDLQFSDSFNAFRNALLDFITGIEKKDVRSSREFNYKAVDLLERGRK